MIVENQLAQSGTVDAAAGINYTFAKLVNDPFPDLCFRLEGFVSYPVRIQNGCPQFCQEL